MTVVSTRICISKTVSKLLYHIFKLVVSSNINFKYYWSPETGILLEHRSKPKQFNKYILFTSKSYVEILSLASWLNGNVELVNSRDLRIQLQFYRTTNIFRSFLFLGANNKGMLKLSVFDDESNLFGHFIIIFRRLVGNQLCFTLMSM